MKAPTITLPGTATTPPGTLTTEPTEEEKIAAEKERLRILTLVLQERGPMTAQYRALIRHTGSLLSESMVFAYNKAISDVFKLITKGLTDEKPVQEEK